MGHRANVAQRRRGRHCPAPAAASSTPSLDPNSLTECWHPLESVRDLGPDSSTGHGRGLGM